jgi:hypothetical protein
MVAPLVPGQGDDDVTVYMVVNDFEPFGVCFVETKIANADLETIIQNLRRASSVGSGLNEGQRLKFHWFHGGDLRNLSR